MRNLDAILDRAKRHYGAHPGHALLLLAGFGLCALAFRPLLADKPVPVLEWFGSGAVLHDAVVLPLYVGADAVLVALWRRHPGRVSWLNFVRIPAAVSLLLLVVAFPVISNRAQSFHRATGRDTSAYLPHWLFVTALLFAASSIVYLLQVARRAAVRRGP